MYIFGYDTCENFVDFLRTARVGRKETKIPWLATHGMTEDAVRKLGDMDEANEEYLKAERSRIDMRRVFEDVRHKKGISGSVWRTLGNMAMDVEKAKKLKLIVRTGGEYNFIPVRDEHRFPREICPSFAFRSLTCEVDIRMRQIVLAFLVEVCFPFGKCSLCDQLCVLGCARMEC